MPRQDGVISLTPEGFQEALGVADEDLRRLGAYVTLLEKWQAKINLVSADSLNDVWRRHILDSAQLGPLLPPDAKIIADIGSGAGFPGLVLAILGSSIQSGPTQSSRSRPTSSISAPDRSMPDGMMERPGISVSWTASPTPASPALGLLTINALVAAQAVLVPLQCEFYALEGISQLVNTIERVKAGFNPGLDLQGIVLTMHDRRNNLSGLVADDVRKHFGDKVYKTMIPRNVRVSEAPSHGRPVIIYDLNCPGSRAYLSLAGEVIHRERRRAA